MYVYLHADMELPYAWKILVGIKFGGLPVLHMAVYKKFGGFQFGSVMMRCVPPQTDTYALYPKVLLGSVPLIFVSSSGQMLTLCTQRYYQDLLCHP